MDDIVPATFFRWSIDTLRPQMTTAEEEPCTQFASMALELLYTDKRQTPVTNGTYMESSKPAAAPLPWYCSACLGWLAVA